MSFRNIHLCRHGHDSTDPGFADDIKAQSPLISNAIVEGSHVVPLEKPDILGKNTMTMHAFRNH